MQFSQGSVVVRQLIEKRDFRFCDQVYSSSLSHSDFPTCSMQVSKIER